MRKNLTNFKSLILLFSVLILPVSPVAAAQETTTIEVKGAKGYATGTTNTENVQWTSTQTSPVGVVMTLNGGATFSFSTTFIYCKLQNSDWTAKFTPTDADWYVSKVDFYSKAPASSAPVITAGNGQSITLPSTKKQQILEFTENQEALLSFSGCPAPTTTNAASPYFDFLKVTLTKKSGTGARTGEPKPEPEPEPDPEPEPTPTPTPTDADITLQVNPSMGTFANNSWTSASTSPAGAKVTASGANLTYSSSWSTPNVKGSAASATVELKSTVDGWYVCAYSFTGINNTNSVSTVNANGTTKNVGFNWDGTAFSVADIAEGTPATIIISNTSSSIDFDLKNLTLILRKMKGGTTPAPDPVEPDPVEPSGDTATIKINSNTGSGTGTVWNSTSRNPGLTLSASGASLTYNSDNVYADFQSGSTSGSFTLTSADEWYVSGYSFKAVGINVTLSGNGKSVAASFAGNEIKVDGLDVKTPAIINYTFNGVQSSQKNIQLKDMVVTLKKRPRIEVKAYTLRSADGKAIVEIPSTGFLSMAEAIDRSNPSQLWVIEANGDRSQFTVRNYLTGHYLTAPIGTGCDWRASFSPASVSDRMTLFLDYPNENEPKAYISPKTTPAGRFLGSNAEGGVIAMVQTPDVLWTLEPASDIDEATIEARKTAEWTKNSIENVVYIGKTTGTIYRNDVATTTQVGKIWKSTSTTPVELTFASGAGNTMDYVNNDIRAYTGATKNITYTLGGITDPSWYISGFSFVAKNSTAANNATITTCGKTFTSSATGTQVTVTGIPQGNVITINFRCENTGTVLTDFIVFLKSNTATTANLRPGSVYRFVNSSAPAQSLTAPAGIGNVTLSATVEGSNNQLWYVEGEADGEALYLRNLASGYYLTSPRAAGGNWQTQMNLPLQPVNRRLKFTPYGSGVLINTLADAGTSEAVYVNGYACVPSGSNVVSGTINGVPSVKWSPEEVTTITSEQLTALQRDWRDCTPLIEPGKVYRLRNYNSNRSMTTSNGTSVTCTATNFDDDKQMWLVETTPSGDGYYVRNYNNGRALYSPRSESSAWSLVNDYMAPEASSALEFIPTTTGYTISPLSRRGSDGSPDTNSTTTFAHENGGSTIVCWRTNGSPSSFWCLTEVEGITPEQIKAKRETWEVFGFYNMEQALDKMFTDKSCGELTEEFASMTVEELQATPEYLCLSPILKNMVMKVYTGDWSEVDTYEGEGARDIKDWDSKHAKQLRLQIYEPFSMMSCQSRLMKVGQHGNHNNPTGIIVDSGTTIYVMVEKVPQDGAFLRIGTHNLNNGSNINHQNGVTLRPGLNVIPIKYTEKGPLHLAIHYGVNTVDAANNRIHRVSEYEDIKIHIEGGSLNGYFNYAGDALYEPDQNEDWDYYAERARSQRFIFLGRFVTTVTDMFSYTFDGFGAKVTGMTVLAPKGRNHIRESVARIDLCAGAEEIAMGTAGDDYIREEKALGRDWYDCLEGDPVAPSDFREYCNNRYTFAFFPGVRNPACSVGFVLINSGFQGGSFANIYNGGSLWMHAHEFGHHNQKPMMIAGTGEISNNYFSNICAYITHPSGGRTMNPAEMRAKFNAGTQYMNYDVKGCITMYSKLWLYYHALGRNKKYSPRLYALLRQDPIRKVQISGSELLENDSIEFNRPDDEVAEIPMGDIKAIHGKYDMLHLAKQMCKAAGEDLTDYFEAWGFFRPLEDGLTLGDYTTYTVFISRKDIADWKAEIAQLAKENGWKRNAAPIFIDNHIDYSEDYGPMGSMSDYREPKPIEGTYSFSVSGTTVTLINGSGGVGFIVRDPQGTLIGFSNNPVFEVNEKTSRALLAGQASIYVVEADGTEHLCTDMFNTGTLEEKFTALDRLLAGAKKILDKSTFNNPSIGYLRDEYVKELIPVYADLRERRDNDKVNESTILDDYNNLNAALIPVYNLRITDDMTSKVVDNGIYYFASNLRNKGVGISADATNRRLGRVASGKVNPTYRNQWWRFEPAEKDGYYYIHNMGTDLYIGTIEADNTYIPLEDEARKVAYLVTYRELGGIALSANGVDYQSLGDNGSAIVRKRSTTIPGSEDSDKDDHRDGRWKLTLIDNYDRESAKFDLNKMIVCSEALLQDSDTPDGEMKNDLEEVLDQAKNLYNSSESTTRQLEEICDRLTEVYNILNGFVNNVADRLTEMIERTRALTKTIGTVTAVAYPMFSAPRANYNFLFSNGCTATGTNKNTKWTVLVDNSLSTVFSTKTATNTSDGEDPYIRALLPATAYTDLDMQLVYSTSANPTETWAPTAYTIETSADGVNDWTECQRVTESLPVNSSETYYSEWFKFKVGQKYVRFKVTGSRHNVDDAEPQLVEGHPWFNISEFNFYYMVPSFEPDTENYPKATEAIMHDAWIATLDAERVMLNRHTRDDIQRAYNELMPYYQNLLDLLGKNTMEITNVKMRCTDDSDHSTVVYDYAADDLARSPIGYKIDMMLVGLPEGYPVRLAEVSFVNTETGETYVPKSAPSPADHGFFSVNYPLDMPLGHYRVKVMLPESDEYEAYEGEMPQMLLDIYMKSDDRVEIITYEGLQSLDVTHIGSYLSSEPDRFVYRLPEAPA